VHGYKRLVIADGSVLPSAAGSNPSLTIAALADRFADRLIDDVKKDRKKGLTCRSAH
jgi:cholesterol oxidase